MDKINYDNFVNPKEAVLKYLDNLFPLYVDDYGEEFLELIKERIEQTVYVFDSLPTHEITFCKANNFVRPNQDRYYEEWEDFFNYREIADKKVNRLLYKVLANFFGVGDRYVEELLDLDIDSFSYDKQWALNESEVFEEDKEEIRKRQRDYKNECKKLNVKCITSARKIEKIFSIRDNLYFKANEFICKKTKWAKRIRKMIFEETGEYLSDIDLVDLLFDDSSAAHNLIVTPLGKKIRVCYFPLIENFYVGNLDGLFFHENRHVVEMGDLLAGIHSFKTGRYGNIDEIRTEKNAIRDKKTLGDKVLFASGDYCEGFKNIYEKAFSYTGGFIDEHLEQLNKFAINNDIRNLEKLYGGRTLGKYDAYLGDIISAIDKDTWIYADTERRNRLVKKLNRHYDCRQ